VTSHAEPPYTLSRVREMLGVSRAVLTGLIDAGFVSPMRGTRNEHRFTFQDLMLVRTAYSLQLAKIPPRKILRSLLKLKASLPEELPLTGMRITAIGADVVVHDRLGNWAAESGQLLMDFEVARVQGVVTFLQPRAAETAEIDPGTWLTRGEALETTAKSKAEAAYRNALALAPDYVDAYLNLGALLCDMNRCDEAVQLYQEAFSCCAESALLLFNHAIALEDQGRLHEAVASYEHCLKVDPALADAHFNLARLQEQLGDERGALRHFSTYRRLQNPP